jgi:hypothetical protein
MATIRFAPVEAKATVIAVAILAGLPMIASCNPQRQQDCEKIVSAMKELDEGAPNAAIVDQVNQQVQALQLQDQPLQIYAENYRNTLSGLSSSLRLNESSSAPDGTDDVIKSQLKIARTDSRDVQRYCSQ